MKIDDVFDEYGNYKFPDYDNSKYINNARSNMVMTIDKTIEELKAYHHGFTGYAGDFKQTIDNAIEMAEKYKKIEKVLERIWNIPAHLINKEKCLDRIMETYREVR